jgi:NADH-quinone oxidoreductase subunit N
LYNASQLSDQLFNIREGLAGFLPEIALSASIILIILADLILKEKSKYILPYLTAVFLFLILAVEIDQFIEFSVPEKKFLFFRFIHINQFEVAFKIFFAVAAILTLWFIRLSNETKKEDRLKGEFYSIFLALVLGLNLMVMSSNLLMLYLSIEFVSICSYILVTFGFSRKSTEAGLKYILFGAFSSALMLYGMSFLYGFSGSLQFMEPSFMENLEEAGSGMLYLSGILILSGFLFKIAATPFHLWAPDVYQGGPVPLVTFFSIAPKAAGFAVIINFTYPFIFNHLHEYYVVDWQLILGIISILTMTIGNLAALGQNNAKKLLAFSSIAHAGLILGAASAFSQLGVRSIMFYLSVYLPMNFVAFALVDILAGKTGSENVRNFRGLGGKIPVVGVIFVLVLIALTGLPPTAGFNAKLLAFSALWESYQESERQIILLVLITGLVNTVIALFYYLKIPFFMFFRSMENKEVNVKLEMGYKIYLLLMAVPLIALFFRPDWLTDIIQKIILNF